ncbi:MAG: outer membrane protein assembly factor BamD [Paludibacter sp.]|nr:outer membrane protein assembly factor BamD [Bacteroidales bacterium]MCM1069302.1 outer membrane protein assembly factor BamD [Prevotella sp.]MCM1353715.1 outer membrane protein assembly factor BamD [Bacteroides sp.]MCM1442217.1 outer membrane protein assembly factor BamD [Muribaculum sp.]MCM1482179.1 outer membrane protein assembly factor BamD [Paludibacter sp.]
MSKKGFIIGVIALCCVGCSEYQKLLKSTDPALKYDKAIEYFNKKDYVRAQTLLDDVSPYYKGTERSEDVLIYLARCYTGQKDYTGATEYYQVYIRNYPKGRFIIEARYMIGHCYYLDSPDARLDQAQTHKAIEYFTQFIELYPESPYVAQAAQEMNEMYDKLAQKEFLSARLYYNLGSYLGNNYESCIIVAQNALKKYPGNSYQEELCWYILQAKYQEVLNSIEELKEERLRDAADEYYNFVTEYPDSKHRKAADRINNDLRKRAKK